jgi:hypothetical protein
MSSGRAVFLTALVVNTVTSVSLCSLLRGLPLATVAPLAES